MTDDPRTTSAQLAPSDSAPENSNTPVMGLAATRHLDPFQAPIQLTMNMLTTAMQAIQSKLSSIETKIDSLIAHPIRLPCIFCDSEEHRSSSCTQFPDIVSRSLRLRDRDKCTSCLATAHGICLKKCRNCGEPHHAILCNIKPTSGPPAERHRSD
ncbi:unnamed protein product [Haemonchus placei]|uniref:Phorbol-ester/DAG-type domain-containing protein n=1 Tax=Haemonchus placei TaxID=6290 RepID=A0A0N4WAH1_HAEPC|nr:unnamed protein product [Haemonchus placei]